MRDAYQVAKIRAAEASAAGASPGRDAHAAGGGGSCLGLREAAARVPRRGLRGAGRDPRGYRGQRRRRALRRGAACQAGAAVTAIQAGPRAPRCAALPPRAAGRGRRVARGRTTPGRTSPPAMTPGGMRHAIGHADLIIDGLLGIGGKGGLREPYATLAQLAANSAGTPPRGRPAKRHRRGHRSGRGPRRAGPTSP